MAIDDNRDLPLMKERADPKEALIREVEMLLEEYWSCSELHEQAIALVGKADQMTLLLYRFLVYKGFDVMRLDTLAEAQKKGLAQMVIVNIDGAGTEEELFTEEGGAAMIAYTRSPDALKERGLPYEKVISFPFDPSRVLELLHSCNTNPMKYNHK